MAVRKTPGRKTARKRVRKTATKTQSSKTAAKKPAKKAGAKTVARKTAASKRTAAGKKAAGKKGAGKKASGRKIAGKSAANKRVPPKSAAKKSPVKKSTAKKSTTKRSAAKKAASGTPAVKKPVSKAAAARKGAPRHVVPAAPASRPPAAAVPVSARKPARTGPRRTMPGRAAEPRSTGVRKVAVRTAVHQETSGAPAPTTARRPGTQAAADRVRIKGPAVDAQAEILTPEALAFLTLLHRQFDGRRLSLLARRQERQARFDAGDLPDFLHGTRHVRSSGWRVTGLPALWFNHPRVVTVPAEAERIAAALATDVGCVLVDFEDAAPPTWARVLEGHLALRTLWREARELPSALIMVGTRGWHLPESHLLVEGDAMSGALFDAGLALFHGARQQADLGAPPCLSLPKLESSLEARLWSDVLTFAERQLGLPRGTCKVQVPIETLPALFEVDEIVFELREHVAALSLQPAGLLFSMIKRLGHRPEFHLPDRADLTEDRAFLGAAARLVARTCQRRGIGLFGSSLVEAAEVDQAALLAPPAGRITAGARTMSAALALEHLETWLQGRCESEPGRTSEAELARGLVWQWLQQEGRSAAGAADLARLTEERLGRRGLQSEAATAAAQLFLEVVTAPDLEERLTLLAYRQLVDAGL